MYENIVRSVSSVGRSPKHGAGTPPLEPRLEHLALLGGAMAARLLVEQPKNFDHRRRAFEIQRARLAGPRIRQIAEMNGSGARERQNERGEGQRRWHNTYQII